MNVYINDDFCDFYWGDLSPEEMNEERLKRRIDFYAGRGGVTAVFFNLNASRAFFDSTSRTPIWDGLEDDGTWHGILQGRMQINLARNCRALFRNVADPIGFQYRYCHQCGVEMWLSMRMNDVHHIDRPQLLMHDDFWRNRPDRCRAPWRGTAWNANSLDYAREDVFEHNMALMEEYFDRFDMDGFEVDWMRTPPHTRPGLPDAGRSILTRFLRCVRAAADRAAARRGHPIRIAVRIPDSPQNAWYSGMDVTAWAREGLIDIAIPSPYFWSTCHLIPVELWRQLLGDAIEITPCLELHISMGRDDRVLTDLFADTGFTASFYAQGADGIYLYNHFPGNGYIPHTPELFPFAPFTLPYGEGRETQREFFSIAGDYRELCRRERRHVFTCNEEWYYEWGGRNRAYLSPAEREFIVPFDLGIVGGNRTGYIVCGLPAEEDAIPRAFCNGQVCISEPDAVFPYSHPAYCGKPMKLRIYRIPAGTLHDRSNTVELIADRPVNFTWLELDLTSQN